MNFLVEELKQNEKFNELLNEIKQKKGQVAISGLTSVEKCIALESILENNKKL